MKTSQNEQVYFIAAGNRGEPVFVTDEAKAKELRDIRNELENLTETLNDPNIIMDEEWRALHEAKREQLWARKSEILKSI